MITDSYPEPGWRIRFGSKIAFAHEPIGPQHRQLSAAESAQCAQLQQLRNAEKAVARAKLADKKK